MTWSKHGRPKFRQPANGFASQIPIGGEVGRRPLQFGLLSADMIEMSVGENDGLGRPWELLFRPAAMAPSLNGSPASISIQEWSALETANTLTKMIRSPWM